MYAFMDRTVMLKERDEMKITLSKNVLIVLSCFGQKRLLKVIVNVHLNVR